MSIKRKHSSFNESEVAWRHEVSSSFLAGSISAEACRRLAKTGTRAGAIGAEDLVGTGNHNVHRQLVRTLRRNSHWPKFYYADIPIWDLKKEELIVKSHPFLLPHEWLAKAKSLTDMSKYAADEHLHPGIFNHMQGLISPSGLDSHVADYTPLGLHCDGVPYGSQVWYQDSLELFSINMPCGPAAGMRIPFTSVQKNNLVKYSSSQSFLCAC